MALDKKHLETRLSAYLDNELSPRERREVEAAIASDPDLRALLEELRLTIETVGNLPRARASGTMMEAVRAGLERQSLLGNDPATPAERRRRSWPAYAAMVAALALTIGSAMLIWPIVQQRWAAPANRYAYNHAPGKAGSPMQQEKVETFDEAQERSRQNISKSVAPRRARDDAPAEATQRVEAPGSKGPAPLAEPMPAASAEPAREEVALVEATFDDAAGRREAIGLLQSDLDVVPVHPPSGGTWGEMATAPAALELRVRDGQSARRTAQRAAQLLDMVALERSMAPASELKAAGYEKFEEGKASGPARPRQLADAAPVDKLALKEQSGGRVSEERIHDQPASSRFAAAPPAAPSSPDDDMSKHSSVGGEPVRQAGLARLPAAKKTGAFVVATRAAVSKNDDPWALSGTAKAPGSQPGSAPAATPPYTVRLYIYYPATQPGPQTSSASAP